MKLMNVTLNFGTYAHAMLPASVALPVCGICVLHARMCELASHAIILTLFDSCGQGLAGIKGDYAKWSSGSVLWYRNGRARTAALMYLELRSTCKREFSDLRMDPDQAPAEAANDGGGHCAVRACWTAGNKLQVLPIYLQWFTRVDYACWLLLTNVSTKTVYWLHKSCLNPILAGCSWGWMTSGTLACRIQRAIEQLSTESATELSKADLVQAASARLQLSAITVQNALNRSVAIVSPDNEDEFPESWASVSAVAHGENTSDDANVEGGLGTRSFIVDHLLKSYLRPAHAALLASRYGLHGKPMTTPEMMVHHGYRTRGAVHFHLGKAQAALKSIGGAQLAQLVAWAWRLQANILLMLEFVMKLCF
jgi:hypothetical protein